MGKGLGTKVAPVAAGVRTDLDSLLRQFCAKETLRFQKFAPVFRSLQMSTIFCGRQNAAELVEFSEKLLQMAAGYALSQRPSNATGQPQRAPYCTTGEARDGETQEEWRVIDPIEERSLQKGEYEGDKIVELTGGGLTSDDGGSNETKELEEFPPINVANPQSLISTTPSPCFQERVCGVYMMYSLYYLQPSCHAVPIRVTPAQLADIERLMDERLRPEGHTDVLYCLCRLLYDEAFRVVAYDREHNPLLHKRYEMPTELEESSAIPGVDLHGDELTELLDDLVTLQADTVHRQYVAMKDEMGVPSESSELRLVRESPGDLIRAVRDGSSDERKPHRGSTKTNEGDPSVIESRSKIRQKAYRASASHHRPSHHKLIAIEGKDRTEACSRRANLAEVMHVQASTSQVATDEMKRETVSSSSAGLGAKINAGDNKRRRKEEKKSGRPAMFAANTVFDDDRPDLIDIDRLCEDVREADTGEPPNKKKKAGKKDSKKPARDAADQRLGDEDNRETLEANATPTKRSKASRTKRVLAPTKKGKETGSGKKVDASGDREESASVVEAGGVDGDEDKDGAISTRRRSPRKSVDLAQEKKKETPLGRGKGKTAALVGIGGVASSAVALPEELDADRVMQKLMKRLGNN